MKRITLCLLALLMIFSLVSCGEEDTTPAGYQKASLDTVCDYVLYVPDTWVVQSGSAANFTAATVANGDACNVSMMTVEEVYAKSVEEYWAEQAAEYAAIFGAITVVEENAAATVGNGENKVEKARRYVFTAKHGAEGKQTDYTFMQVFIVRDTLNGSKLYCFTYTATTDHYDGHLEAVNGILTNFAFR